MSSACFLPKILDDRGTDTINGLKARQRPAPDNKEVYGNTWFNVFLRASTNEVSEVRASRASYVKQMPQSVREILMAHAKSVDNPEAQQITQFSSNVANAVNATHNSAAQKQLDELRSKLHSNRRSVSMNHRSASTNHRFVSAWLKTILGDLNDSNRQYMSTEGHLRKDAIPLNTPSPTKAIPLVTSDHQPRMQSARPQASLPNIDITNSKPYAIRGHLYIEPASENPGAEEQLDRSDTPRFSQGMFGTAENNTRKRNHSRQAESLQNAFASSADTSTQRLPDSRRIHSQCEINPGIISGSQEAVQETTSRRCRASTEEAISPTRAHSDKTRRVDTEPLRNSASSMAHKVSDSDNRDMI